MADQIKIYLKDSEIPHLANKRIRITYDKNAQEPTAVWDFVYVRALNGVAPTDAIHSWTLKTEKLGDILLYTTEERCKRVISPNPSDWTAEKLAWFAEDEGSMYKNWAEGKVYSFTVEKWVAKARRWQPLAVTNGLYSVGDMFDLILEHTDGVNIPVCIDDASMSADFENVEPMLNAFD